MNRSELIDLLARRFPLLSDKDVELAVKCVVASLSDALARGDRIEIRGFGSFALRYRPSRASRNPKTGEPVIVPPKYRPYFKSGKELRGESNGGSATSLGQRLLQYLKRCVHLESFIVARREFAPVSETDVVAQLHQCLCLPT